MAEMLYDGADLRGRYKLPQWKKLIKQPPKVKFFQANQGLLSPGNKALSRIPTAVI